MNRIHSIHALSKDARSARDSPSENLINYTCHLCALTSKKCSPPGRSAKYLRESWKRCGPRSIVSVAPEATARSISVFTTVHGLYPSQWRFYREGHFRAFLPFLIGDTLNVFTSHTHTLARAQVCTCVDAYIDILNYVGVGDAGPGDASATHREIANGIP